MHSRMSCIHDDQTKNPAKQKNEDTTTELTNKYKKVLDADVNGNYARRR